MNPRHARHDVLSHLVFAARGDDVRFTTVDVPVLMVNGDVTSVDADRVRSDVHEVARELGSRPSGTPHQWRQP